MYVKKIKESQEYKDKVSDKSNVVFVVVKSIDEIPNSISEHSITKNNIWFVLYDGKTKLSGNVFKEGRTILIEKGKIVKQ